MSEKVVDAVDMDSGRRKLLIGATSALGAVGMVGAAIPFVRSWNPSAKAKAAGAPVQADISQLEEGQKLVVEWRGRPVWLIKRSQEALKRLVAQEGILRDPQSTDSKQPGYAKNPHRSVRPEVLVLIGLCTHLGCAPVYRPELEAADLGKDWMGGFFCPCHGSKFDLAGRVYKGVPAPTNLDVPPHMYVSNDVIVIGKDADDEENA